jgi:hypothetical protein
MGRTRRRGAGRRLHDPPAAGEAANRGKPGRSAFLHAMHQIRRRKLRSPGQVFRPRQKRQGHRALWVEVSGKIQAASNPPLPKGRGKSPELVPQLKPWQNSGRQPARACRRSTGRRLHSPPAAGEAAAEESPKFSLSSCNTSKPQARLRSRSGQPVELSKSGVDTEPSG